LLRQRVEDRLKHSIEIGEHIVIPETNDPKSLIAKRLRSGRIRLDRVLTAIGLHNKPPLQAAKIDDMRAERPLTAKFVASQSAILQLKPKRLLGVRSIPAQRSRMLADRAADDGHGWTLTRRRPSSQPSPAGGRRVDRGA
jgi:hypothetical protein